MSTPDHKAALLTANSTYIGAESLEDLCNLQRAYKALSRRDEAWAKGLAACDAPARVSAPDLLPRWRLWRGLCPRCNSDAPKIDSCQVCESFGDLPSLALKRMWWARFLEWKAAEK